MTDKDGSNRQGDLPTCDEVWTVGQHPAVTDAWVVPPALFASRIRVLPAWEGGGVMLKRECDTRLIAAAPDMFRALEKATAQIAIWRSINGDMVGALAELEAECRAAIQKATTASAVGTKAIAEVNQTNQVIP